MSVLEGSHVSLESSPGCSESSPASLESEANDFKFSINEVVLCFYKSSWYEAICIQHKFDIDNGETSEAQYLIHYLDWSSKWNEWVNETRLLKYNLKNQINGSWSCSNSLVGGNCDQNSSSNDGSPSVNTGKCTRNILKYVDTANKYQRCFIPRRFKITKDEIVLCTYASNLYKVQCLLIRYDKKLKGPQYLVHYKEFSVKWDEWVDESRLYKLQTPERNLCGRSPSCMVKKGKVDKLDDGSKSKGPRVKYEINSKGVFQLAKSYSGSNKSKPYSKRNGNKRTKNAVDSCIPNQGDSNSDMIVESKPNFENLIHGKKRKKVIDSKNDDYEVKQSTKRKPINKNRSVVKDKSCPKDIVSRVNKIRNKASDLQCSVTEVSAISSGTTKSLDENCEENVILSENVVPAMPGNDDGLLSVSCTNKFEDNEIDTKELKEDCQSVNTLVTDSSQILDGTSEFSQKKAKLNLPDEVNQTADQGELSSVCTNSEIERHGFEELESSLEDSAQSEGIEKKMPRSKRVNVACKKHLDATSEPRILRSKFKWVGASTAHSQGISKSDRSDQCDVKLPIRKRNNLQITAKASSDNAGITKCGNSPIVPDNTGESLDVVPVTSCDSIHLAPSSLKNRNPLKRTLLSESQIHHKSGDECKLSNCNESDGALCAVSSKKNYSKETKQRKKAKSSKEKCIVSKCVSKELTPCPNSGIITCTADIPDECSVSQKKMPRRRCKTSKTNSRDASCSIVKIFNSPESHSAHSKMNLTSGNLNSESCETGTSLEDCKPKQARRKLCSRKNVKPVRRAVVKASDNFNKESSSTDTESVQNSSSSVDGAHSSGNNAEVQAFQSFGCFRRVLEHNRMNNVRIDIKLPLQIRTLLVDDWEVVQAGKKHIALPAKINICTIVNDYLTKTKKNSKIGIQKDNDRQRVVNTIITFFNAMLSSHLLYDFEWSQYVSLRRLLSRRKPSTVFGVVHLCRLFIHIGEVLTTYSLMNQKDAKIFVTYSEEFLKFLSKNLNCFYFGMADYVSLKEDEK